MPYPYAMSLQKCALGVTPQQPSLKSPESGSPNCRSALCQISGVTHPMGLRYSETIAYGPMHRKSFLLCPRSRLFGKDVYYPGVIDYTLFLQ